MERPTSVTVIAILQIIFAVIGILFSLLGILGGALLGGLSGSSEGAAVGGLMAGLFIFTLILSVVSLVLAIGLFQLKSWAWMGTLIVQGIGILIGILQMIQGDFSPIVSLVISGVIIWVLVQPNVKRAFGQA